MSHITLKGLRGKVAIVTGSTFGIGYSIAHRLAKEGAKVIVSSRKEGHVEEAVNNLRAQNFNVDGLVCHVASQSDREKLFERAQKLGGLDILVCNAGANPVPVSVFDTPESAWDKTFEVNVKASFLLSKEALPLLKQSKAGRIIYISSITGINPNESLGVYSVAKTALCSLTKVAALQLGKANITVNCVAPGIIRTKFSKILYLNKEMEEGWISKIPLNRFGNCEDVSSITAFLASEEAAYITGENIVVAGGMVSRI